MSSPASSVRKRSPRLAADLRREQILEAAITAFANAGYRDVSTASIAAALDISEPALFRHFPTKRTLYVAAIDRSAETLIAPLREIAVGSTSPLSALLAIGQWYFNELQADSRHLRLRFRSSTETSDTEVAEHVRRHFLTVFEVVHGLYEAARTQGEIDPATDTRAYTWLFFAIGTLLDTTQIIGLRSALPLEDIPAIMLLATPKPSLELKPAAKRGKRSSGIRTPIAKQQ